MSVGTACTLEQRTWVVVPAHNEGSVIRRSLHPLCQVFPNVVTVDDGSSDDTTKEALATGSIVLRHPLNLGQGAAIQTGIDYALSRGAAYIATFDADGQHRTDDLRHMLEILCREDCEIVLGSRFLGNAKGIDRPRRWLIRAAAVFTRLTTGVALSDAHNGLRVMTASTARRLTIAQSRMAHASEIVAQIGELNLKVREAPVTITYSTYSKTKGQRMSGSLSILVDLFTGWLLR